MIGIERGTPERRSNEKSTKSNNKTAHVDAFAINARSATDV